MKTTKHLLILLLLSAFLIFGTGCAVLHPQHRSKGVITHSNPRGKTFKKHTKKYSGVKSSQQFAPGKVKKHKKNK